MKDLFGNDIYVVNERPKEERLAVFLYKQLISIYGKAENKKCIDCVNCQRWQKGSKRVFKCAIAKNTDSQSTDWNSRWGACGKFENKINKNI